MAETVVYTPEQSQANNILPWMLAAGNGGFGGIGGNGIGGGILGFLLGLFLGNNGGLGNLFGGGNNGNAAAAGFLSNQFSNDSGRELLMQAVTSQGEASRAATQNLATMIGQDFNLVNSGVQAIQGALSTLALQQAVSVPQIINSIQNGNAALASQLCECCCNMKQLVTSQGYENQIATLNQTNALGTAITGSGQRTVDAIADLKASMIQSFCDAKERDMQDKINTQSDIITQLRGQLDNDRQTAQFTALLAPIQSQINSIAAKQINTVPVAWPNLTAVNTTPYAGNFYGYGWNNGINF